MKSDIVFLFFIFNLVHLLLKLISILNKKERKKMNEIQFGYSCSSKANIILHI